MQRLTISLDDGIAHAIDEFMRAKGYNNRSEAIRDLVRDALVRSDAAPATRDCVAAVSYVYDYDGRDLALRLDRAQHEHHDLTIASMRTRLDHRHCMEVTLLKGETVAVRKLAETVIAERGVRFGQVNLVPIRSDGDHHTHGDHGHAHSHSTPVL
ncbi:MAG TPA: nickel-responsive transcriptional regulator NikR [Beijerinckiaceae bacterium]|jgi:CopG family nickel-responsive transcriptional regulator